MEKRPEVKDNTIMICTKPIKIELGAINRVAMGRLAARWWWTLVLPLLAFLVAGTYYDSRWLFLIPIFACLLFPVFGTMAFLLQTSGPRLAQSLRPHYIEIERGVLRVIPIPDDKSHDSRRPFTVVSSDIADTSLSGKHIVIDMRDRSFLLIPLDACDDRDALITAVDALVPG